MKKRFEMPVIEITSFFAENVLTGSGNVGLMQDKMKNDGYTVTIFSLKDISF